MPSTMVSARSTSPPKSACPGVSTMLNVMSFHTSDVFFARIVIPFSRSRSIESMTRSATVSLTRNAPDCCSIESTSVVLPWSTWATIAMLRRSSLLDVGGTRRGRYRVSRALGVLRNDQDGLSAEHLCEALDQSCRSGNRRGCEPLFQNAQGQHL